MVKASIRKKLLGMLVSIALLFGISNGISYYYLKIINDSYTQLIERQVHVVANVKDMEILALQQTNALRGYLLTHQDFLVDLQSSNTKLQDLISQTKHDITLPETSENLNTLEGLNRSFKDRYEQLLKLFTTNKDQQEALQVFTNDVLPIGLQLSPLTKTIVAREQSLMDHGIADHTRLAQNVKNLTAFVNLISFILVLLIGLIVSRNVTRNLRKITEVITSISMNKTDQLPRITVNSNDEIGDIASAFNTMAHTLEHHAEQERQFKLTMEEQRWLETHVAEITTLYQGIQNLETFATLLITKIPPTVRASQGIFYMKQGSKGQRLFYRLASYAADFDQKFGFPRFHLGEGLVGQCAQENRTILLTDIPDNYLQIASGTGKALPKSIIILPIAFEDEVIAVIELASFSMFTPIELTLLERLVSNIGITVNSISGRMQVEKLLEESQTLTEELQSQSEELQLQQEELKSINEKLEEQYKNSELKSFELEKATLELEEKARQLTLSSKYKSEFLANMSHELRTPLNSMLILARILADNQEHNLSARQVEYADTVYSSGNDLLHLINDILDLSKVEAGKMDISPHELQLADICTFVNRQFLPVSMEKGLAFTVRLDENVPSFIYTDEQRLQQILKNLLSNAFKFTEQGSIDLHVYMSMDSVLAISISDTGIGIPERLQGIIFEAFQQGDGTNSRKFGGTGLGLTISREMAHLLGGYIHVESEEGVGSTFTLYIPLVQKEPSGKNLALMSEVAVGRNDVTPTIATIPDISDQLILQEEALKHTDMLLTNKRILIIDDDMRNVFALSAALESHQMEVLFADNGRKGIEVLQSNPAIDLILMDIMMPELDGYETMHAIRQIPKFENLPIIALTAKAMKNDRGKCIEAGASDYISKPIHLEQLLSLIRVWLFR